MLRNKHILIVSPQNWEHLKVSKHNYAMTLASLGNFVFFISGPERSFTWPRVGILSPEPDYPTLYIIKYNIFFPYRLKFKFRKLYDWGYRLMLKLIQKRLPATIDIVWDFAYSSLFTFSSFTHKPLCILHPVDQVGSNKMDLPRAQIIFSLSSLLLGQNNTGSKPLYFIPHGLNFVFERLARERLLLEEPFEQPSTPKVGYFGNLLLNTIHVDLISEIIKNTPDTEFYFWGEYKPYAQLRDQPIEKRMKDFIFFLEERPNVFLMGRKEPEDLAKDVRDMDAFLICYHEENDPNKSSNSHKILEYLSTGRVVVANYISDYDQSNILTMTGSGNSSQLPALFSHVVHHLEQFNSPNLRRQRIEFALENTYENQIKKIERILINHHFLK